MMVGRLVWVEKIPFFMGIQTRGVLSRWLARCVKHPSPRPWGYLRIERFSRATLVSGSHEPKVVNACTYTRFPSPSFNFLSHFSKQLPHKPFIVPQPWIIEACALHKKDAPRQGESILTIRSSFIWCKLQFRLKLVWPNFVKFVAHESPFKISFGE
jgi:hypothetical protein